MCTGIAIFFFDKVSFLKHPKGHVLSFVLPKILEQVKTFHKFYAMEEMGESIHAAMNDIERKIWFVLCQDIILIILLQVYQKSS